MVSAFGETPESIVRQTYAKAVFAHQVYLLETRQSVALDPLVFTLSDFQTGTVAGNQQPLSTIYASSAKDALQATLDDFETKVNQSAPVEERSLDVQWLSKVHEKLHIDEPVEVLPEIAGRISDLSISFPWATSYVSYNVTVTYQGRTASARAHFLFGDGKIAANDPLMHNTGLNDLLTESVYPNGLLQLRSDEPQVKEWLKGVQTICERGKVCCTSSSCGVSFPHNPGSSLSSPGRGTDPIQFDFCSDDPDCLPPPILCSDNDFDDEGGFPIAVDYTQHYGAPPSQHGVVDGYDLSCSYVQNGNRLPNGQYPCKSTEQITWTGSTGDQGHTFPYFHTGSYRGQPGIDIEYYPTPSHLTVVDAGAVSTCLFFPCAPISISFSGLNISFNPNPLWDAPHQLSGSCPATTSGSPSPIVIDLDGGDFNSAFTSRADGVRFNFTGRGAVQMPWTSAARNIGFLVLDRNGNGVIDNGKELFGNLTMQGADDPYIHPFERNGFNALAMFDTPEKGGNGNGMIDPSDAVWPKLRVWVDTCHCGKSQFGKLYTLDDLGIEAIPLLHRSDNRTDQYGNQMRFRGTIRMKQIGRSAPAIYDVFFTGK
jgi:hypothetical protein